MSYTGLTQGTWNEWCGQLNRPFDQLVISAHVSSALPVEIKTYLDEIVIDYDIVALTPTPNRNPVLSPQIPNCQTVTPAPTRTRTPTATPMAATAVCTQTRQAILAHLATNYQFIVTDSPTYWSDSEIQEVCLGVIRTGEALQTFAGIVSDPYPSPEAAFKSRYKSEDRM
ncbi:MAG: hypothetical protein MUF87_19235 [Anaerolineae bacterium]|nr:hypothetical protein [Anaerolineae bacterium]